MAAATLGRWVKEFKTDSHRGKAHYSPEQRRLAVTEFIRSEVTQKDFAKIWGISEKTLGKWISIYKNSSPQGLEDGMMYGTGVKRGPKRIKAVIRKEILKNSEKLPEFGLKKLQNFLYRFEGIKVAPNTIKKVLAEESAYQPKVEIKKKKAPPAIRRFERAKPMQMWQTDITSYVLPRSKQNVYLVVFMDDNSRYIVSWSLALKQTGAFVMECLMNGVDRFGKPEEVLSDQGRQYFSWRGKSEFQKLLHQEGIQHVVSRSHHPQTLGKCERFWKTVGSEFWDRTSPNTLDEARARFSHYVNHYNHFRPHQGIDGMKPSDRFFELADEIRESIEKTFVENELRTALDKAPRKPFFFVGQVGDQKISMHGEKGKIVVQTPSGEFQKVNYEEFGKQNTGRNDREIGNYYAEKKTESKESTLQDATSGSPGEGVVGGSDPRTEGSGPIASDSNHRMLDGSEDEERDGQEAWSQSPESMADEPAGSVWDVRGALEATESEEEYDPERRRSEIFEEENLGARADDRNAGPLDRDSEIDARLQGSRIEGYDEDFESRREETWQEAQGTAESSSWRSEGGWFKKDEE